MLVKQTRPKWAEDRKMQAKFEAVTPKATEGNGSLVIIRGGNRITNGDKQPLEIGEVTTGRYEGAVANKFQEGKMDYKVRQEDGTLVILAECSALKRDFSQVAEGELVQVTFAGKRNMTGKNAGKTYNDFNVLRAIDSAE